MARSSTRENIKDMIRTTYKNLREEDKEFKQKYKILNKNFRIIKNALDKESKHENNAKFYSSTAGWSKYIYELQNEEKDLQKVFTACMEILEFLRGEQNQEILIFKTNDKGEINIFTGKESTVNIVRDSYNNINYYLKDLKQIKTNNAFINHYNNFKNLTKKYYFEEERESKGKKYMASNFNEGHVYEAFTRHLYYQHNIKILTQEIIDNSDWTEPFDEKNILISLWYATRNEAWYTGGDVGNFQVKYYNNRKITTYFSLLAVVNKLYDYYKNGFDINDFDKRFTQKQLDDMTKELDMEDPNGYAMQPLNELLKREEFKRFNITI